MDELSIWSLHERNSSVYFRCKDISKCPTTEEGKECLCIRNQIVCPIEIGHTWTPICLETCAYIPYGASCPICLSSISQKKNAWITHCGHAFHRTCLIQSYNSYMNNPNIEHYGNVMPCPMCRADLPTYCCGFEIQRYQGSFPGNGLDRLEDYEHVKEIKEPLECWSCCKYLGMNKSCNACIDYCKNGTI